MSSCYALKTCGMGQTFQWQHQQQIQKPGMNVVCSEKQMTQGGIKSVSKDTE